MRIVQVNVIYGHGSTGRIVETLHQQYLKLGHDSYVLFGRGKKSDDKRVTRTGFLWEAKLWRLIQLFTGNTLNGSPLSTWNLKRHIMRLKPDVVSLHCINGNMCNVYGLLKWLRKRNIKTALTHHGSFMYTGGCGLCLCDGNKTRCVNCKHTVAFVNKATRKHTASNYRKMAKMHLDEPWIRHIFVSPWSMESAKRSDFMAGADMRAIFNPVNTEIFTPEGEKHVSSRPYVFFPFSAKAAGVKGGQFVAPLAERLDKLGIDLITTGDSEVEAKYIGIGYVSDPNKMASLYRGAQTTVLMSSVESFSMPVAESILCGTPVVGFKCGAPETIETKGMATFVSYGDLDALITAIQNTKDGASSLVDVYSPEAIANKYLETYVN